MFRPSIRFRLLLWFGILIAGLVAGFGMTAFHLQKIAAMGAIDAELEKRVELVSEAIRKPEFDHRGGLRRLAGRLRISKDALFRRARRRPGGFAIDLRAHP